MGMTLKRKTPASDFLQRRVRPRRDELSEDDAVSEREPAQALDSTSDDTGDSTSDDASNGFRDEGDSESSSHDENNSDQEDQLEQSVATVSFGALARAQETLQKSTKTASRTGTRQERPSPHDEITTYRDGSHRTPRDSRPSHAPRSSKHAPTELTSKKAVSRRREVVLVPKRDIRDPRFEQLTGPAPDPEKLKKQYGFLEEYRADEMRQLKAAIKSTRDEGAKEQLKRELLSMESRQKAAEAREREQAVVRRHRKEEREAILKGKKPFYLKRAEQKKLALVERFGELKGKKLERVIERRRRKEAGKERKRMPADRRGAEGGD